MFYSLRGTVIKLSLSLAVIECGGVGFSVNTTATTAASLSLGEEGVLYTYLSVREDALELFGFSTEDELNCFKMLIGINGVGPKAAISILSSVTPEGFALAVISEDEKTLTAAPGIGKKIAQRIILELKDKLQKEQSGGDVSFPAASRPSAGGKMGEAAAALGVLGYAPGEIAAALKGIEPDEFTVEQIVKKALVRMVKN